MNIVPNSMNNFETKKYVFAYFDVIGTKRNLVKNEQEVYTYLWWICQLLKEYSKDSNVIIKTFSDNFLVLIESDEAHKIEATRTIIRIIGHMMADALTVLHGYPRGVISYGDLHVDEDIVIGPALVRAYEIEQKYVLFPRIILDTSTISPIPGKNYKLKDNELIFKDIDGKYAINPLECIPLETVKSLLPYLFKGLLSKAHEEENTNDPNIFIKYDWLIDYVNEFLIVNDLKDSENKFVRR